MFKYIIFRSLRFGTSKNTGTVCPTHLEQVKLKLWNLQHRNFKTLKLWFYFQARESPLLGYLGLRDHSLRLRGHFGRVRAWESVCWGVLGSPCLFFLDSEIYQDSTIVNSSFLQKMLKTRSIWRHHFFYIIHKKSTIFQNYFWFSRALLICSYVGLLFFFWFWDFQHYQESTILNSSISQSEQSQLFIFWGNHINPYFRGCPKMKFKSY